MPMQQQMSSFAKKLGGRVAAANAEHKDKPVDLGRRQLPPGIRNGIAKLSMMYTKEQTEENSKTPKGQVFFRASAIVVAPQVHNGDKVEGMVTQVVIPLCDVPASGERKAETFSENWYEFQNLFKLLGIQPPPETQQTDPTGARTEAYYHAAMRALTDPKNPSVYISFSTRGWTPPATVRQPKPSEMVFETWHGIAKYDGKHDPAAGVTDNGQTDHGAMSMPPEPATQTARGAAPPPVDGPPPQYQPDNNDPLDPADEVTALVEVALDDPEGATEEGREASARLEKLAWSVGWTKEQTANASDWAAVGAMALEAPPAAPTEPPAPSTPTVPGHTTAVTVGAKFKFAKRTKDGAKLKNNKGEEFPPQDVEITTVDEVNKTCTVRTIKDGKDVVDIRSKQPIAVKWEWLETIPY